MEIEPTQKKNVTQSDLGLQAHVSYGKRTKLTEEASKLLQGSEGLASQLSISSAKPYLPTGLESFFTPAKPIPLSIMEPPADGLERLISFFGASVFPFCSDDLPKTLLENLDGLPETDVSTHPESAQKIRAMLAKQVDIIDAHDQAIAGRNKFMKG